MDAELSITLATPADDRDLRRLARLENRHGFSRPAMVARAAGVAVAAVSLDGRDAVADPFRCTADVVAAIRALIGTSEAGRPQGFGAPSERPFPSRVTRASGPAPRSC
jgi:hypothetical protein